MRRPDAAGGDVEAVLRVVLGVVQWISWLVPRHRRSDWLQEWRAEIRHRWQQLDAAGDLDRRARLDILARSLGSLRHAVWLRSEDWRPDAMWQDIRYAARTLLRTPLFTLVAVLTLAVGIGANTVVFGMVSSVLISPLPYEDAERLVSVGNAHPEWPDRQLPWSYPDFADVRERARTLDSFGVWDWEPLNLRAGQETVLVEAGQVTASVFEAMGVEPLLGRTFREDEDQPGAPRTIVLRETFWRDALGADEGVVGETVVVDGLPHTVLGVMPAGFEFPESVDVWVPLQLTPGNSSRGQHWLGGIARLAEGTSVDDARAEVAAIMAELAEQYPETNRGRTAAVQSLRQAMVGEVVTPFLVLLGAVGFLLLIVCANVGNLMLARASTRDREMALRAALGAGRTRIVRQLLTESLVLAAAGCALGFVLGYQGSVVLFNSIPVELPVWIRPQVSLEVMAYTAGVSALAALLFGLAPALQVIRADFGDTLRGGHGRAGDDAGRVRLRSALVVAEVALSLTLLVGAGLMVQSFLKLARVDPGFQTEDRLLASLALAPASYREDAERVSFMQRLLDRVQALPDVESAALVSRFPLRGSSNSMSFTIEGQSAEDHRRNPQILLNQTSTGYFRTMGIPLLQGREFRDADGAEQATSAIVNETFARRYFPEEGALGRRLKFGPPGHGAGWLEIVGVVGDIRHFGLEDRPGLQMYLPLERYTTTRMSLVAHARTDVAALAASVREAVRSVDPNQALYDVMTVGSVLDEAVWQWRFISRLFWIFGGLAAGLAAVGIYGVVSYTVARRTQELGVRLALGATRAAVLGAILRHGLWLVGLGLAIGLVAAFGVSRVMAGLLYETSPTDMVTYAGVCALLAVVAVLATLIPAVRATRVDPLIALRTD